MSKKAVQFDLYYGGCVEYHPKKENGERDLSKTNTMVKLLEVDDNNSCNLATYIVDENFKLDILQKLKPFSPVTAFIELNVTNARYQKLIDIKVRTE